MKLMDQIRAAINDSHQRIENTAFSKALLSDYINPRDYARGMAQMWYVHRALEDALSGNESLRSFFSEEIVRTPTIVRDLDSLAFGLESFHTFPETLRIVDTIQEWGESGSYACVGCLYVLEGSRMGSMVISRFLRKALGNEPDSNKGIEYHTEGAATTPMRVRALKDRIDNASLTEQQAAEIKLGAVEFMELLNDLYDAIPVATHNPVVRMPNTTNISQSA